MKVSKHIQDPCFHLVSISQIFYEQLFHMKVFCAAFSYESFLCSFYMLTIWVCNFLRKDFGAKAAHKMLVKWTPGGRKYQLIYPYFKQA
jgi:hypothetical protein